MGSKTYSLFIKGKRVDINEKDLDAINKSETVTQGGRKFVHIVKDGNRIDILKEKFDDAIKKAQAMMGDGKMVVLVADDPEGKYHCSTCTMYIPETGECTNVLGHIEPHGTCQLHVQGPVAKDSQVNPFRLLKDEAGYDEREEGFGCIRCIRYKKPDSCKIIKDKVNWNNCCNYQFDGNSDKSDSVAGKYKEEQMQLAAERLESTGGDRKSLEQKIRNTKKSMLENTIKKSSKEL